VSYYENYNCVLITCKLHLIKYRKFLKHCKSMIDVTAVTLAVFCMKFHVFQLFETVTT